MSQITIPPNDATISTHVGATPSTGPFAVDFPYVKQTDVIVELQPDGTAPLVRLIYGTDYSLVGVPTDDSMSSTGTVTLVVAVSNTTVIRRRDTTIERGTNFPLTGYFSRLALNFDLNRITMVLQDFATLQASAVHSILPGNGIAVATAPPNATVSLDLVAGAGLTLSGTHPMSMAVTNALTPGSMGSASSVPVLTWTAQGMLSAVGSATITPAAIGALALSGGTMTGAAILAGVSTAPTAAPGTNTTQIASTAFVRGELGAYAPLASPALTGNPTAPTPAAADNDTSIATTAFVTAAVATAVGGAIPTGPAGGDLAGTYPNPTLGLVGTSGTVGSGPDTTISVTTDTKGRVTNKVAYMITPAAIGAAPLASPGLTGVPTAPTAAVGTSTTQLATTAFVTSNGWRRISRVVPTAALATLDFTALPADINDIELRFDVFPTANANSLAVSFFDNTGTIDNTAAHYQYVLTNASTSIASSGPPAVQSSVTTTVGNAILLDFGISTRRVLNSHGMRGRITVNNIRDATLKSALFQTDYTSDDSTQYISIIGSGRRAVAQLITGIRLNWTGTTFAAGGAATLWGSP